VSVDDKAGWTAHDMSGAPGSGMVYALSIDDTGRLYVATSAGVAVFQTGTS
jgi:ligand-binding sensor domain-containing protein